MAVNKIIYGGEVKIDLTGDTVTASDVTLGKTFHDKAGDILTGTSTKDSDTSADTAAEAEILEGKSAHARGSKLTGTMPNNGSVTGEIATKTDTFKIQHGYHDGSGTVGIASTEQAKIVPANIREGVTILGVEGTMSSNEGETPQANKTVTPSKTQQVVTPDEGFTCLMQVTVNAIPYAETPNSAGGTTVTIG